MSSKCTYWSNCSPFHYGDNVSSKLIPSFCWNPQAMNQALNLFMVPLTFVSLYTPILLWLYASFGGRLTYFQIWFFSIDSILDCITSCQLGIWDAFWKVEGISTSTILTLSHNWWSFYLIRLDLLWVEFSFWSMIVTNLSIWSLGGSTTSSGLVGSSTLEYDYMGRSTWMLILGGEQLGCIFSFFTIARCLNIWDSWLICGSYVTNKVSMNLTSQLMNIFLVIKGCKIYNLLFPNYILDGCVP
jgi:hypothetical protein